MKFNSILLAGGLSSRMGVNKALLSYKNQTLLQATYNKIKTVINGSIVVSGNYTDFQSVPDEKFKQGPIEGIWSCLQRLNLNGAILDSAVLVVPVDMPLLTSECLKELIHQFKYKLKEQRKEQLFLQFENFEMPFVFIYNNKTKKILNEIRELENSSSRSIRYFKQQMCGESIHILNVENFKNINTPQDWKEVFQKEVCP